MENALDRKNMVAMKLLHYFITEKNYNPIILQGAEDEIWLENLSGDYKIIRIVSHHIHNDEQLDYDLYKTKHITKKIKKKTFSLNMSVLSIFTDVEDRVNLNEVVFGDCISLYNEQDIVKYDDVFKIFPDIDKKMMFSEDGFQLFMKITSDINNKNKSDAVKIEEVFKPKKPIVTIALVAINIIIFLIMNLGGIYDEFIIKYSTFGPSIVHNHEFYRLFTGAFLHGDIVHIGFNMYALYIIGSQMESFMGKVKYLIIYFFSILTGSLLSIIFNKYASVGASGAIFGLMGALLYFGYHYRVYLGGVLKNQIIPIIVLNLLIGFIGSGLIDNYAHIGGLIGGTIITVAVGVKYRSTNFEKINGLIVSILFVVALLFFAFNFI